MARLAADYPSDMASPCCVLGKRDVAGSKTRNHAVAGFDLDVTGKSNDVLPPRRGMIIAQMGCRRATKDNPMRRLEFGSFETSVQVEFNFHFFEMRFVIWSGVKSDDLHQLACRKINREKQGYEILFQSFNPFKSFQTFRQGGERKAKPAAPEN